MRYTILAAIADIYSPVLLLAIGLTIFQRPHKIKAAAAVGFYMLGVYGIMLFDQFTLLWPRAGLDYSTHTAFAAVCGWFLWRNVRGKVWRWIWPASLLVYLVLMRLQGYHSILDMVTTLAAIAAWIAIQDFIWTKPPTLRNDNSNSNQTRAYGHDPHQDHR